MLKLWVARPTEHQASMRWFLVEPDALALLVDNYLEDRFQKIVKYQKLFIIESRDTLYQKRRLLSWSSF